MTVTVPPGTAPGHVDERSSSRPTIPSASEMKIPVSILISNVIRLTPSTALNKGMYDDDSNRTLAWAS